MKLRRDKGGSEGGDLCGGGHPARKVGLEGRLIVIASTLGLASNFLHDITAELRREEDLAAIQEPLNFSSPFVGTICLQQEVHH